LNVLHHPIKERLSFLALTISINAKAMHNVANATKIQHTIAKIIEFCEPTKTLLALKKIPDPIQLPTTTSIAEKKPIFFFVLALAKFESVLFIMFVLVDLVCFVVFIIIQSLYIIL